MVHKTLTSLANETVSIITACRLVGVETPTDDFGKSPKLHCPFGPVHHIDQGADAAMRIYADSNSAFCFAGCGYFTPVSLVALAWELPREQAAEALLVRTGYRPPSSAELWQQASITEQPVAVTELAEALKIYLSRVIPGWGTRQFDEEVSSLLARCLRLLDRVQSVDDARAWLLGCKSVMTRALTDEPD